MLLKFPAANRARLRRDIQNLVRSQVMRNAKGEWTEDEEAAFVELVAGLQELCFDLSHLESEQELYADARYRDADDRTKG